MEGEAEDGYHGDDWIRTRTMAEDMDWQEAPASVAEQLRNCSPTLLNSTQLTRWLPKSEGAILHEENTAREEVFVVMMILLSIPANKFYSILFYYTSNMQ